MIYLIAQLGLWLILTLAFAALAGWAFAAQRAEPAERAIRRERDNLRRDLIAMASGEAGAANDEAERARGDDAVRRMLDIRDGRIRELEQALEGARRRGDDAASEIADLQRQLGRSGTDANELRQLRSLAAESELARARTLDVETAEIEEPAREDEAALQMWRLRYFEHRVRYLEGQARQPANAPLPAAPAALNALDWRAREAEARADHLASELRAAEAPPEETPRETAPDSPFAADADVDMLLRWRLLYLERRVAHLQAGAHAEAPALQPLAHVEPDLDRWKWRARYLEQRVRYLEQRAPVVASATAAPQQVAHTPAPAASAPRGVKPPVLAAARNGAPDDFTLIEGLSLLQQSTLNALGVFHFDQIAAWTSDNVDWLDRYFRLNGRIGEEEWIEQAADLARDGPSASRRALEEET